jgi:hypothetical protein
VERGQNSGSYGGKVGKRCNGTGWDGKAVPAGEAGWGGEWVEAASSESESDEVWVSWVVGEKWSSMVRTRRSPNEPASLMLRRITGRHVWSQDDAL